MIGEWRTGKDVERSDRGLIKGTISEFPGGTKKNHENLGIAGIRAEIWTRYLPNTTFGY
jgi:hypothetical protein